MLQVLETEPARPVHFIVSKQDLEPLHRRKARREPHSPDMNSIRRQVKAAFRQMAHFELIPEVDSDGGASTEL